MKAEYWRQRLHPLLPPTMKNLAVYAAFLITKTPLCSCEGKRLCLWPWFKMLTSLFGFKLCAAVSPLNVHLQTLRTLFRAHSNIMFGKGRWHVKITWGKCLLNMQRRFLRCTSVVQRNSCSPSTLAFPLHKLYPLLLWRVVIEFYNHWVNLQFDHWDFSLTAKIWDDDDRWWQLKGTCDVDHIEKVGYTNRKFSNTMSSLHRASMERTILTLWQQSMKHNVWKSQCYNNDNIINSFNSIRFWNHKFYWLIMWLLQSRCMTSFQTPLFKCHSSVLCWCSCNHFALYGPFHYYPYSLGITISHVTITVLHICLGTTTLM